MANNIDSTSYPQLNVNIFITHVRNWYDKNDIFVSLKSHFTMIIIS